MRVAKLEIYLLKRSRQFLTSNSKVILLLRKKFKDEEVTADNDPKLVCLSEIVFKRHKLDNSGTRFSKLKRDFLVENGKCRHFACFI